jgi:TolB-like protein/tRNA A-37 threonylcarbamoyl transferase component Bud32
MPTAARSCPSCATPLPEEALFCLHCGAATPTEPGVPQRTATTGLVEVARVRKALASRYRVERVLGEGGMATVYLAVDLKHNRKVALKVMRPELAATLGSERFLREVEIAGRLNHPHILPMHDSGEADGLLYYVMPYIDGESLRDRIKREGQLPVEESLRLAREVSEALAYAHSQGVIHRDMKPANVLLSAGHALVADFGIARAMGGDAITHTGLAIGTPQYMSPEQAMGSTVDGRTDVYSVGAVLYEMLAGDPPFGGPNSQAILTRSLTEPPRALTASRPAISPAINTLVTRALEKDPTARYADAKAFADALQRGIDQARQTSGTIEVQSGVSPGLVWGLFAGASAIALMLAYLLVRSRGLPSWTLGFAVLLLAIGAAVLFATGRAEKRRIGGLTLGGLEKRLTYRNAAIGGVLAMMLWALVSTTLTLGGTPSRGTAAESPGAVRLAVLPFENRGDPADAYFADGIADEMRGKLASLGGFQITARSSSDQYRQTTKTPQQVGQELNVDYLLSATIRWAKGAGGRDRVQVVPEVINVKTGGVAWQQSFDADLTDVFQVQSQIASRLAGALGVALGTQDTEKLTERPTDNLAAYDLYLKGRAVTGSDAASLREALRYFEQATTLDSTFADAWARMANALLLLYSNSAPDPAVARRARAAIDRAMALAPEAPETHTAEVGYAYTVQHDPERAAAAAEAGLKVAPNDAQLLARAATVERSLGKYEVALNHLTSARRLDPRSQRVVNALQNTYLWLRRYPEALAASEAALSLAPGDLSITQDKSMIYVAQGDLAGAREVIRQVSPTVPAPTLAAFFSMYWDMFWVLEEPLQQVAMRLTPSEFDGERTTWSVTMMQVLWNRGEKSRALAFADTANAEYNRALKETPDDPQRNVIHGLVLAYLGRKAEAIAAGERGVGLLPITRDAQNGPYYMHQLARIYVMVGEPEKAIDALEQLLRIPYFLSTGWLRIDPTFASLKGHPRYERLLKS